ncbi:MAG TPA: hypothetical protein VFV56_02370 [Gaiellaceae bacterium]|jgi:hypothetical protein|nr:hypothetical protein [Gaiellaceae bacterium]
MACFLVETYVSRTNAEGFARTVSDIREAADELRATGVRIRHVRSYAVAEDETWFHVFEADSTETVLRATTAAGIDADRVVEAVGVRSEP